MSYVVCWGWGSGKKADESGACGRDGEEMLSESDDVAKGSSDGVGDRISVSEGEEQGVWVVDSLSGPVSPATGEAACEGECAEEGDKAIDVEWFVNVVFVEWLSSPKVSVSKLERPTCGVEEEVC